MTEIIWKPVLLSPRPRYSQGYQNKYIYGAKLFCWHFLKVRQKVPLSLKRWEIISGFISPSSLSLPSYLEESKFVEIDKSNSAYAAQHEHLALIQRLSRSENVLYGANLENLSAGMMSKSCDNLSAETNKRTRHKSNIGRWVCFFL